MFPLTPFSDPDGVCRSELASYVHKIVHFKSFIPDKKPSGCIWAVIAQFSLSKLIRVLSVRLQNQFNISKNNRGPDPNVDCGPNAGANVNIR